jgi:nesprin-1
LQQIAGIEDALKHDDGLPPTLVEKLSETRLLLKTLPADLMERQKYLDENKSLRQQYEDSVGGINGWIQDARKRLAVSEGGVDFENILPTISEHKVSKVQIKIILNLGVLFVLNF